MSLLQDTLVKITAPDTVIMQQVQDKLDSLIKPAGSLGRLGDMVRQYAGITG